MTVSTKRGASQVAVLAAISLVVVFVLLVFALRLPQVGDSENTVRVYCASGVAQPIESIVQRFNEQHNGSVIVVRTGGSGELAGQIKTEVVTGIEAGANVYISADRFLVQRLEETGTVQETAVLAFQTPVIAMRVGSNAPWESLSAVLNDPSIKLGVGSSRSAIGQATRSMAQQAGLLEVLEKQKRMDAENVMVLGQALVSGSVDVAVLWDATITQINQAHPEDVVVAASDIDLGGSANVARDSITASLVMSNNDKEQSRRFLKFMTTSQFASDQLVAAGFTVNQTEPAAAVDPGF
ncbi:MAG: substrate-binding domain-containing protein [Planctomycetota bacterium]